MGRDWQGGGLSSNKGHFDGLRQEEPHTGHVHRLLVNLWTQNMASVSIISRSQLFISLLAVLLLFLGGMYLSEPSLWDHPQGYRTF